MGLRDSYSLASLAFRMLNGSTSGDSDRTGSGEQEQGAVVAFQPCATTLMALLRPCLATRVLLERPHLSSAPGAGSPAHSTGSPGILSVSLADDRLAHRLGGQGKRRYWRSTHLSRP